MKKLIAFTAAILTFGSTAFAQIGSTASDLVYTPVTPCRLFDTRTSQGGSGAINAGETKTFKVRDLNSFASQGGAASNCGMTAGSNTAAVAINIVAIAPTNGGYLTAYPAGGAAPLAASINFKAGDVLGNASIVKVAQGFGGELSVFSTSQTDVAGDVVGYYSKPVATALVCQIVSGATTTIPAGSGGTNAAAPSCPANTFYTASYCVTNSFSTTLAGFNRSLCNFKNPSAGDVTAYHEISCCQIPGR